MSYDYSAYASGNDNDNSGSSSGGSSGSGQSKTVAVTPNATIEGDLTGHAEPGYSDYDEDEMVQFERVGFARVDQQAPNGESVAYYAHP